MKFTTVLGSVALATSLSAPAFAINLGGVDVPSDLLQIDSGSFYQNYDVATGVLSGHGEITAFNNDASTDICPGCELTYVFNAFNVDLANSTPDGFLVAFQNGTVDLYVDSPGDFDINDGSTAVGPGAPWLSLAGSNFAWILDTPTLGATTLQFGTGQLDVVGGTYAANFDTNTITDNLGGFSDFSISSSIDLTALNGGQLDTGGYQPSNTISPALIAALTGLPGDLNQNLTALGITSIEGQGSADLTGAVVPEPGILALMGLGILGFGAAKRKRAA